MRIALALFFSANGIACLALCLAWCALGTAGFGLFAACLAAGLAGAASLYVGKSLAFPSCGNCAG